MKKFFLLLLCFSNTTFALDVTVDGNEFRPFANEYTKNILIKNNTETTYAGEIQIKKRKDLLSGEEVLSSTQDFSFQPIRVLLPPDEEINLVVNWKGPKTLDVEQAYRLIISQKNFSNKSISGINNKNPKFNINLSLEVQKSLFVLPEKGKADTQLVSLQAIKSSPEISNTEKNAGDLKKNQLKIVLSNKGNLKEIISKMIVVLNPASGLEPKSTPYSFSPKNLQGKILILPNTTREFYVDWPEDFPFNDTVQGNISFERSLSTE